EGIPAAADIVNLRYKSCSEMEGQDQKGGFDHGNDGGGYPIVYLFPVNATAFDITLDTTF
ncbi:hypothetical protein, partial [Klebsiella pneumoniae]